MPCVESLNLASSSGQYLDGLSLASNSGQYLDGSCLGGSTSLTCVL